MNVKATEQHITNNTCNGKTQSLTDSAEIEFALGFQLPAEAKKYAEIEEQPHL